MNRILEVAVPIAVTATAAIATGFFFSRKSENKKERKASTQPDLLSDLPGPAKDSEVLITADEPNGSSQDSKSEQLAQSDNGNSIASQFDVVSEGDLAGNDLEMDQVEGTQMSMIESELQSLVFVEPEEGQGDASLQRRQGDFTASINSGQSLMSQYSVVSGGSSVSDIEAIGSDDSNNNGDINGNTTTGIIAQETGGALASEELVQSISDLEEDEKEVNDILILHTESDRDSVIAFVDAMKRELPDLRVAIFEEFAPDIQSQFTTMTVVFDRCRYLFVYVTENFTEADLQKYQNEMALLDSLSNAEKRERVIPVWTCPNGEKILPELGILVGLHYQEGRIESTFRNQLRNLITHGRSRYLLES